MSKDSHGIVKVNVIDNEFTASASVSPRTDLNTFSSEMKKGYKQNVKPDIVVLNSAANEETTRFSVHHETQNQNDLALKQQAPISNDQAF